MPSAILRLGGIYGPGRTRIAAILNPDWKLPAEDAYMNLIHVEDIVQAVALLFKKAEAGSVFLGCDGQPPKRSEFYAWLCEQLGKSWKPSFDRKAGMGGKRCRNDRLCALGQSFRYPSFREGYGALLAEQESKHTGKEI
jgi:nucleoside-diphosphate-sugar epimerase